MFSMLRKLWPAPSTAEARGGMEEIADWSRLLLPALTVQRYDEDIMVMWRGCGRSAPQDAPACGMARAEAGARPRTTCRLDPVRAHSR